MKLPFRLMCCLIAPFLLVVDAFGQGPANPEHFSITCAPETVKPGVVVEEAGKNSQAERAGMREGDILLRWVRGEARGDINTPFDLMEVETEQSLRGPVTIEGLRGGEKQVWELGEGARGVQKWSFPHFYMAPTPNGTIHVRVTWELDPPRENYWIAKSRPDLADSLLQRYLEGQQLAEAGKFKESADIWRTAVGAQEPGCLWLGAWFSFQAAKSLANGKQWMAADAAYEEAIRQAMESGPVILGILYRSRAYAFEQQNDWANAEKYYVQAMAERRKLDIEDLSTASSFRSLANMFARRDDYAKAEYFDLQALSIQQKLAPDSLALTDTVGHLARIASKRGELAKTAEYCRQALTILDKISPGGLDVAHNLSCLGNIALARRDLASAEKYNHQALTILEKFSTVGSDVAGNLNNLGLIALSKGDLNKAIEYQTQALKIEQEVEPNSQEVADILNNLGMITWQQGNLDKATAYLTDALQIQQKLAPGGLDAADTLNRLGLITWMQRDLARAGQSYRQAVAIEEKLAPDGLYYAQSLAAIATITMRSGDVAAASQLYDEALAALENSPAELGGSADVRLGFRAHCAQFYDDYIDLLVAQHQPERAFEILERWRARTLLETLAQGHVDIRKGVDSTLLEQKRSLDADIAAKSDRRLHLMSEEKPQEQLATLDTEIDGLLSQYHDVEGQILANSPSYAALTQAHPLTVHELQLLLDDNTLLLEYSLGKEGSYVFVVSSTSVTAYKLPKRADIENLARNVYGLLTARGKTVIGETEQQREARWANADAQYARSAARLSRAVLDPIAELLEQKRLLIVSDGALQYIPFAALPIPKAKTQIVAAVNPPLALEHEIVNLPSASVLAELRRERTSRVEPPKSVVILADPVFEGRDERVQGVRPVSRNINMKDTPTTLRFSPDEASLSSDLLTRSLSDLGQKARGGEFYLSRLPYTRKEAKEILAVTPAGKGTEVLDFEANRARAMDPSLRQYRIVHFATHGLLNNRHPELSGLVFSLVDKRGKPQDGFLTLQDIYNLDLPVDLVVLSGCRTGLGEEIDGEGLIGLTRGFMYAGASRVVASMWSVSDEATAELMARFYKAMEEEKIPPAAALREAQVQMWRQKAWSAPYYWAAFQIQGEWK